MNKRKTTEVLEDEQFEDDEYDEIILDIDSLPMDEQSRWMVKVVMVTRNMIRRIFGMEYSDQWGHFIDHYMAKEIGEYSDWIDYPTGDHVLMAHSRCVMAAVISNDGHYLFTGSGDQAIAQFDLSNYQTIRRWVAHDGHVLTLAFHRSGLLISGSTDKSVRVWDTFRSSALIHTMEGHTDLVLSVDVNDEGSLVVSGSQDSTLRVWSLNNGRCLRILSGHTSGINSVRFIGEDLVSASKDYSLKVWDSKEGRPKTSITVRGNPWDLCVNCDRSLIACMFGDFIGMGFEVWKWPSMDTVHSSDEPSFIGCFHPRIPDALGLDEERKGRIQMIRIEQGTQTCILSGYDTRPECIRFTPDGSRMICAWEDSTTYIRDLSELMEEIEKD